MNTAQTFSDILEGLHASRAELLLVVGLLAQLLLGLINGVRRVTSLLFSCGVVLMSIILAFIEPSGPSLFNDWLRKTELSETLKLIVDVATLMTFFLLIMHRESIKKISEVCALLLTATLGAHLLLTSHHTLMMILSIELISLPSYLLVASSFTRHSAEASVKYFLFGAVASAVLIYGTSLYYGATGTLFLSGNVALHSGLGGFMPIAGLMILTGLLFKIAAFPMHLWAPDVYEATPLPLVAFLSTVPKLAALGFLYGAIDVLSPDLDWRMILAVIAIATICIGNFSALIQKDPARMMAYSSIAQSGFMMIPIVVGDSTAGHFLIFYSVLYVAANFLVFHYIAYFRHKEIFDLDDFKGIGFNAIAPSVLMLVGLISLTGLPPTGGFTAKLFIFSALWKIFQDTGEQILVLLLVVGLLNTVISLFFYLKIPFYAFLSSRNTALPQNIVPAANLLGVILVLIILASFVLPGVLTGWINTVNFVR